MKLSFTHKFTNQIYLILSSIYIQNSHLIITSPVKENFQFYTQVNEQNISILCSIYI